MLTQGHFGTATSVACFSSTLHSDPARASSSSTVRMVNLLYSYAESLISPPDNCPKLPAHSHWETTPPQPGPVSQSQNAVTELKLLKDLMLDIYQK